MTVIPAKESSENYSKGALGRVEYMVTDGSRIEIEIGIEICSKPARVKIFIVLGRHVKGILGKLENVDESAITRKSQLKIKHYSQN